LVYHHYRRLQADDEWRAHRPAPVGEFGTTDRLRIVPLVDWYADDEDLHTEAGVSYLVETDERTILFDTGNNADRREPAPLVHNMRQLGVELGDIDDVVISHAHYDHVGGRQWTDGAVSGTTFGIGNDQPDLSDKRIFVPADMTYPGSDPKVVRDPVQLGSGVATTGTIPRRLFIGKTDEQALAIHLRGRGIVLVVGCGHQTLTRLIERTEAVFDAPIYGVVGGLHYPVPEGRMTKFGINLQRVFASGTGPLEPVDDEEIRREVGMLADRDPGLVSISPHDSSDEVIERLQSKFGEAYRPLRVGRPIEVEAPPAEERTPGGEAER
jgi:7,8-dihydropterin-6-yl-methyl-4-(beta-D-ribofuranosyl)aminobenzene 5'-phosphate synthase